MTNLLKITLAIQWQIGQNGDEDGNGETDWKAITVNPGEDDGASSERGGKWLDSGDILKIEPTGCGGGRRKGVKDGLRFEVQL